MEVGAAHVEDETDKKEPPREKILAVPDEGLPAEGNVEDLMEKDAEEDPKLLIGARAPRDTPDAGEGAARDEDEKGGARAADGAGADGGREGGDVERASAREEDEGKGAAPPVPGTPSRARYAAVRRRALGERRGLREAGVKFSVSVCVPAEHE